MRTFVTSVLKKSSVAAIVLMSALGAAAPAQAGDCTGYVVGVRPLNQYDHTAGRGFLSVRTGPGGSYQQIGELYLGDEFAVWDRRGNWYLVQCMAGRCTQPYWGQPSPNGWAYGNYLSMGGVCP
ncbi:SH3 domain-containing protein [Roseisalinus antarcticus]|uniref:Bacterial SH3 domain protein n=1 Tax=Roseisalinus antarcticus TaxID=254357 RepID=A0A1Y5SU26_9RHOB|nr:SH3 domain-containing protein [Roseisalinus antarcticus]SLN48099.1 Bacterial SH3 domain protein [Roseisalinus antarcticus]